MSEHYYLPTINVSFCVIPKTGCTTLKNYLFNLEQWAKAGVLSESGKSSYVGQDIHRPQVLRDFLVSDLKQSGPDESLKILVLRNPFHRTRSAWVNKLLFAQHDYRIFDRLKDEEFTPIDFQTTDQLSIAFEKFAERLSTDKEFLYSDGHWLPQVEFFGKVSDYDVVLETQNLASLEGILARQLKFPLDTGAQSFPRFNETSSKLVAHIGSKRAWDLISQTYKADLKALESASIEAPRPDQAQLLLTDLTPEEIEVEKVHIIESRRQSEVRSLRIDLADHDFMKKLELSHLEKQVQDIKSSWSWRLTAWLRWLAKPASKWFKR